MCLGMGLLVGRFESAYLKLICCGMQRGSEDLLVGSLSWTNISTSYVLVSKKRYGVGAVGVSRF